MGYEYALRCCHCSEVKPCDGNYTQEEKDAFICEECKGDSILYHHVCYKCGVTFLNKRFMQLNCDYCNKVPDEHPFKKLHEKACKMARAVTNEEGKLVYDTVNHPPHYQTKNGMETIDVIEAFDLNFNLGNAIKYILRAGKKENKFQDLNKAIWYIQREANASLSPIKHFGEEEKPPKE